MNQMIQTLKQAHTLGLDLESHYKYSFGNMISLIQISTHTADYLLDPFKTYDEIRSDLRKVLEDPKKLLVVHGAANDLIWLKGELGICPKGVIDVQIYDMLETGTKQGISFDRLRDKYIHGNACVNKKVTDKSICQLADWRLRPLPKDLQIYAQEDSHYVLKIWNEILKQGKTDLIKAAVHQTKNLLLKEYSPPKFDYTDQLKRQKLKNLIFPDNFKLFQLLWKFQTYLGRLQDQNPLMYFTIRQLLNISRQRPTDRLSLHWSPRLGMLEKSKLKRQKEMGPRICYKGAKEQTKS
ncbi:unnamed protein product [Allacma fusca]|uniref:3'-5' exonuclease domain-containing protein n=1 Tax=Allacma fusca TaxID=39272 RepID=A0A8J2JI80_9HEXA|nr:unnamed protein product [Allacma fusca]